MKLVPPVWLEHPVEARAPFPGGTQRVDVAVVGGGFAGLSAAYHLLRRRPGLRLIVLEAGRLGAGASGRTTGMLSPGVGQDLAGLVRRVGDGAARALYLATLEAVEAVCDLVQEEGIDCELTLSGQLVVARGRGGRARVQCLAGLLARLGLPGEALGDDELARRLRLGFPGPPGEGPAALRLPLTGTLHPVKLLDGLARCVEQRGGMIHDLARVHTVGRGRPVQLELDAGTVLADEVVVATAGFTPALGIFAREIIPLRLSVLLTDPLDGRALDSLGWSGREGVLDSRRLFCYFRRTQDDRVVFGGGWPAYWRGDKGGQEGDLASLCKLEEELAQTFPRSAGLKVVGGWHGVIGYTLDGLPAIARWHGNPHVVHAVGWCGHGIALSLASGAWVARLLEGEVDGLDLPWFRQRIPGVPVELARRLGLRLSVALMAVLDRFC